GTGTGSGSVSAQSGLQRPSGPCRTVQVSRGGLPQEVLGGEAFQVEPGERPRELELPPQQVSRQGVIFAGRDGAGTRVSRQPGPPSFSAASSATRTTGPRAGCAQRRATEPSRAPRSGPRPRLPRTRTSASSARSVSTRAGSPRPIRVLTSTGV